MHRPLDVNTGRPLPLKDPKRDPGKGTVAPEVAERKVSKSKLAKDPDEERKAGDADKENTKDPDEGKEKQDA